MQEPSVENEFPRNMFALMASASVHNSGQISGKKNERLCYDRQQPCCRHFEDARREKVVSQVITTQIRLKTPWYRKENAVVQNALLCNAAVVFLKSCYRRLQLSEIYYHECRSE